MIIISCREVEETLIREVGEEGVGLHCIILCADNAGVL